MERTRSRAWLCLALMAVSGCGERAPAPAPASSAPAAGASVLGARPEIVSLSDRLALEGSRATGPHARELTRRAASLRERLYRAERKKVDALEAVELWRALEKLPGGDCAAALSRALLEAELGGDPAVAYRALYAERLKQTDPACRRRSERALTALSGYRPLPSVLAEIERELGPAPSAAPSATPAAPRDVVVPDRVPDAGAEPRITRVERYGAKDAARVVVFVTRPATFSVGVLESPDAPPRLFVDVDRAKFEGRSSYDVGGLVERVRLGAQPRGTRVVLDLVRPVHRRVFYLPEPFRLVIDVSTEAPRALPSGGKRAVRRVVLDPGHGGHDPGAVGPNGLREKDVALDVAHRAAPVLARELGVATLLTRDGDQYVSLDERTARANAFHADLFLSIHCNASEDPAARGVMSFVLAETREELAQRIAARENAASAAAAAELATAISQVTDPASLRASVDFAELLQRSAMASFERGYRDVPDGGVRRAGFYVLAGARMPAVLFETSFISSASGELHLNTEDFRQKLADSIVNAVRAYRDGF